jgi:luciferase-like monooxygenase
MLGIGAAWNEQEHLAYSYRFQPARERLDRLDEQLQIAKLMFTEERPSFEGRYYRLERALNHPPPIPRCTSSDPTPASRVTACPDPAARGRWQKSGLAATWWGSACWDKRVVCRAGSTEHQTTHAQGSFGLVDQ